MKAVKKNGLGRIPKTLSWINDVIEEEPVVIEKVTEKKAKEKIKTAQEIKTEDKPTLEKISNTTQKGLADGWVRATYIVNKELNEKVKALAYWERLTVKEVVHDALVNHLKDRNIKPIPKKTVIE